MVGVGLNRRDKMRKGLARTLGRGLAVMVRTGEVVARRDRAWSVLAEMHRLGVARMGGTRLGGEEHGMADMYGYGATDLGGAWRVRERNGCRVWVWSVRDWTDLERPHWLGWPDVVWLKWIGRRGSDGSGEVWLE